VEDFRELLDDCVHCGFCLPTCPTYQLWGEEMDSPRGRIHLMSQHEQGEPLTGPMIEHFDRCLGCMACVTACPSGVRYDRLIEVTRAQVEDERPRGRTDRLLREAIFAFFPYPKRLRLLRGPLRAYQASRINMAPLLNRISPTLAAMERLAPPRATHVRLPERVPARGERRAVVGMLTGCVQREFFPGVNAATARVLAMEGCDVVIPKGQGCCGALSLHAGRAAEARAFAKRTIESFADVDVVVVNAAGCGSAMKDYGDVLADEPEWAERAREFSAKTRDLTEYLAELGPRATRHPLEMTVAYHDACHLAHAQGVRAQPRDLLRAIPGLELLEPPDWEICCGSAGIYNLVQPRAARELGERKARAILAAEPDVVATANPGCAVQLGAALRRLGRGDLRIVHPAELVAEAVATPAPAA
jgi:glycolate oxidase iron-sulfur subunit